MSVPPLKRDVPKIARFGASIWTKHWMPFGRHALLVKETDPFSVCSTTIQYLDGKVWGRGSARIGCVRREKRGTGRQKVSPTGKGGSGYGGHDEDPPPTSEPRANRIRAAVARMSLCRAYDGGDHHNFIPVLRPSQIAVSLIMQPGNRDHGSSDGEHAHGTAT